MDILNKRRQEQAEAEHRKHCDAHRVLMVQWLAACQEAWFEHENEGDAAEEPDLPPRPPDLEDPHVVPVEWPDVVSGFLFLHHLGISRTQRSNLIRASGGLEFSKLDRILRMSEAEHFTGERGPMSTKAGAFHAETYHDES